MAHADKYTFIVLLNTFALMETNGIPALTKKFKYAKYFKE